MDVQRDLIEREHPLEPIMISALEHYAYCPRQCALIHLEQTFTDNSYTIRGQYLHERVDDPEAERRPGIHREYALPLWSERLGLTGRADLVEFRPEGIYPVEYKSGRYRRWIYEALQLCAQAMCLEEMTGQTIERGAIFYFKSRKRREVEFDAAIRRLVEETTTAVRDMLSGSQLPAPVFDERCTHCSLIDDCLPAVTGHPAPNNWQRDLFTASDDEGA